jgi:hypothetical protein
MNELREPLRDYPTDARLHCVGHANFFILPSALHGTGPSSHYALKAVVQPIVAPISASDRRQVLCAAAVSVYVYRRGWLGRLLGPYLDRWRFSRARVRRRKAGYQP